MKYPLGTVTYSYLYIWHVMTELQNSLCAYEVGINCSPQSRVKIDCRCCMEHHWYVVYEVAPVLLAESKSWFRYISAYGNYFSLRLRSVLGKQLQWKKFTKLLHLGRRLEHTT